MKKKIAVTGGIGSGKSSVLKYLSQMGYPIFSCDEIYREIIHSPQYIKKLAAAFPKCVSEEKIDRKRLAETVFNDKEKLAILNGIAHPLIMARLFEQMNECESEVVFAEVPLLFEGNLETLFDQVVVVMRNKAQRVQAVTERDGITAQEAEARISMQFDYDDPNNQKRFENCSVIFIQNDGDLSALQNQLKNLKF